MKTEPRVGALRGGWDLLRGRRSSKEFAAAAEGFPAIHFLRLGMPGSPSDAGDSRGVALRAGRKFSIDAPAVGNVAEILSHDQRGH